MKTKYKVIYYETEDGQCPVQEFIDSRKISNQAKILSIITELEDKGPNLPRPYSDILRDGIHELRTKLSGDEVRTLYFFCYKRYIILTHSFIKNQDEVPKAEIERAKSIREDFLLRYSEPDIEKMLELFEQTEGQETEEI